MLIFFYLTTQAHTSFKQPTVYMITACLCKNTREDVEMNNYNGLKSVDSELDSYGTDWNGSEYDTAGAMNFHENRVSSLLSSINPTQKHRLTSNTFWHNLQPDQRRPPPWDEEIMHLLCDRLRHSGEN